jgi:hypothetical protein
LLTVLALWNEHYPDNRAMVLDLCDIMMPNCANWQPPVAR